MPRPRYLRTILFSIFLFLIVTYTSFRLRDGDSRFPPFQTPGKEPREAKKEKENQSLGFEAHPGAIENVHNATLGFQKIFVMNLPERPDKLDAFSLASSLTGFTAETLEGVHGAELSIKTLPSTDNLPVSESMRNNMVGCWRAHMNFARKILMEGLTTALVMEDDADWSVYLKTQLQLFATGARYILNTPSSNLTQSPYGDDWDLLWLGHCGSSIKKEDQRRFIIDNDHTVPMPEHRIVYAARTVNITEEGFGNRTRAIYEAGSGLCTYAYALSAAGARKVLQWNGALKEFEAIDTALSAMCKEADTFKCLAVFPAMVDAHKPAGKTSGDSDIAPPAEGQVRDHGHTFNVVHSQRMNIDNMLKQKPLGDGREYRQWGDEPLVEGPARTRPMDRQAIDAQKDVGAQEDVPETVDGEESVDASQGIEADAGESNDLGE